MPAPFDHRDFDRRDAIASGSCDGCRRHFHSNVRVHRAPPRREHLPVATAQIRHSPDHHATPRRATHPDPNARSRHSHDRRARRPRERHRDPSGRNRRWLCRRATPRAAIHPDSSGRNHRWPVRRARRSRADAPDPSPRNHAGFCPISSSCFCDRLLARACRACRILIYDRAPGCRADSGSCRPACGTSRRASCAAACASRFAFDCWIGRRNGLVWNAERVRA